MSVRITRLSNDEMGEPGVQLNRMLDRIQDIMQENIDREVLVKNSEIRALQDELEYIRNYMALINLRNDYAIQLSLKIPEELYTQEIPKMSLQPVVENSILHGIDPLGEDNTIYIKAWAEEGDCVIEISDAGAEGSRG